MSKPRSRNREFQHGNDAGRGRAEPTGRNARATLRGRAEPTGGNARATLRGRAGSTGRNARAALRALRPAQWLKNGIVAAAFFFAWRDPSQQEHVRGVWPVACVALAVFCFCCVSSAVYQLNDVRDVEADRVHPVKRLRPLAAGEISVAVAAALAAGLLALAAAAAAFLPGAFAWVAGAYVVMQVLYTFALKRVAYVDVFVIAFGFVLRAVAGAAAVSVRISPWLLLCTFLLALFLALCKRRHEKVLLEDDGEGGGSRGRSPSREEGDGSRGRSPARGEGGAPPLHRAALAGYDRLQLDVQIAITAGATVVCYAIYTLAPETVQRFGTDRLGLTVPFVLFGIFRYLTLVYQHEGGGRPEKVMLTDRTLIVTVIGYALTVLAIFLELGVRN